MPAPLEGLTDYDLKNALWQRHQANHREMTYEQARELVFSLLHNEDGVVTGVYSGVAVQTTQAPHSWVMNVEHAWPRSRGSDDTAFLSDLHHLYPTVSWVNSARANYAYCDLARLVGYRGEARWGYDADGSYCFEPRAEFKGNAARSIFYISAAYSLRLDPAQERVLRRWHTEDPVDQAERDRNDAVASLQGTRNLFVDFPGLVDQIADF
jgi:endonuclease I